MIAVGGFMRIKTGVSLDPLVFQAVSQIAKECHRSVSDIVNDALLDWLKFRLLSGAPHPVKSPNMGGKPRVTKDTML